MRLAVISDIHSNFPALEAVYADLKTQAVDHVFVAGDAINGCVFPTEVLDLIYTEHWQMVRGNHEQYVIDLAAKPEKFPLPLWTSVHWTQAHLRPHDVDYIDSLSVSIEIEDIVIMHGALQSLTGGFLPTDSDEVLLARYGDVDHNVIVNAHTHLPIVCSWRDKLLINAGSVGIPLDGNPHPVYVVLTRQLNQWIIQHRRVPYDYQRVRADFVSRGFLTDGATMAELFLREIETGRMHVSPFLTVLKQYMEAHNVDMAQAVAQLGPDCVQPDTTYGTPRWNNAAQ